MEKISITRALNTIKLLDKRIQKKTVQGNFVGLNILQEVITPKADFDSIISLINYRNRLKTALMVSNAKTTINVAGTKMLIIEAIERKSSIEYNKFLLSQLKLQLNKSRKIVDDHNMNQERRLDALLEANFGKDLKARSEEFKSISDTFWNTNKAELVDELDLPNKIKELEEEIDDFESEVDLVLSESNAMTIIEA